MTEQERYEAMYDEIIDLKNTINRQRTEIDYLRNKYIPMLEKNLRDADKLGMEYMLENARLQAEIERLTEEKQQITEKFNCQQTVYADLSKIIKDKNAEIEALIAGQETLQKNLAKAIRAEAVKEFAERLDRKFAFYYSDTQCISAKAIRESIQNELKEMAGDTK